MGFLLIALFLPEPAQTINYSGTRSAKLNARIDFNILQADDISQCRRQILWKCGEEFALEECDLSAIIGIADCMSVGQIRAP
jgi:hypothetical protein